MTGSLDDFSTIVLPELAAFDVNHSASFFSGPNLAATVVTAEQGTNGNRIKLKKGFRPVSDSPAILGSASSRETQAQTAVFNTPSPLNPITGVCNMLVDTRYSRFQCQIPAATEWTFINGVEPLDLAATGKR
jgi:hypothetical protein